MSVARDHLLRAGLGLLLLACAPAEEPARGLAARPVPHARAPASGELVSETATTTLTGASVSGYFGAAVGGAGDVDDDGYDDVIVGGYGEADGAGSVAVYHGSEDGVVDVAVTEATGGSSGDALGVSVDGAGDVDGDGFDDVIVGASGVSSSTGVAYVALGSADGVDVATTTALLGSSTGEALGSAVARAGDVNGDGYADVLVGSPGYDASTGRARLFLGSAGGVSSIADTSLDGASDAEEFGTDLAGAGDVDADGYDDVVIGAPGYDEDLGRAALHLGSSEGLSTSADLELAGESESARFGFAVAVAGDLDGDGYDDLLIGAPVYDSSRGQVHAFHGGPDGPTTTVSATLSGAGRYYRVGSALAGLGDTNRDGYDDVVIGAYFNRTAYVCSGTASGLDGTTCQSYTEVGGDNLGYAVAGAGDVDGDRYADVIIGAPGGSYWGVVGAAYVYHGYTDEVDGDGDTYTVSEDCDDSDATVHPGAEETCDGVDQDCDDKVDEDALDADTWYPDADGDGYVDLDSPTVSCDEPAGHSTETADDCDDADSEIHPDATEIPGDGLDQDCDGADDPTGETGETGDTADTGESGEPADTAQPAESGDSSGPDESQAGEDTARPKEPDCGCAHPARSGAVGWVLALGALVTARRRGSPRPGQPVPRPRGRPHH